jgi:hypothetical protein
VILDFRFSILDCRTRTSEMVQDFAVAFRIANLKSKIQNLKWVVAVTLLFVGVAHSTELSKWKEEWRRVVEAAKKEGQLSLYGGQEITHPEILAAFNKEFPFIKVTTTSGRGGDLVARIVAERRADKYLADVMASGPKRPSHALSRESLGPHRSRIHPSRGDRHVKVVRRKTLVR